METYPPRLVEQCQVCEQPVNYDPKRIETVAGPVCGRNCAAMLDQVCHLEREYPNAHACYLDAFNRGVTNRRTFFEIVSEYMAAPLNERIATEEMLKTLRKKPDESAPHCPDGTCHLECKPEGVSSGIALQVHHEAEMERIRKEIQAQYDKLAHPYLKVGIDHGADKGSRMTIASRCARCGLTKVYNDGERPSKQCERCRYIHGGGRLPAMPDVTQYKAADRTRYLRLQDPARDLVVIMAQSPSCLRVVQIDGKVWHFLSGRTNAPEGEVAITDDDLETLLQYEKTTKTYGPRVDTGKLQDKLTRQLFMTDPNVHAYVARHAETPERFPGLMEKAFTMGWTRNPKYPQECAWVEACHSRACAMMGHDPDLK